jgi:hypothetical protein
MAFLGVRRILENGIENSIYIHEIVHENKMHGRGYFFTVNSAVRPRFAPTHRIPIRSAAASEIE